MKKYFSLCAIHFVTKVTSLLALTDKFWNNIISEKDKHIIINGECFFDDGFVKNPNRYTMLGYGGRFFILDFLMVM